MIKASIRQDFGIKTIILQKINQKGVLYRSCGATYAQNPVTILEVKIGFVVTKGAVYYIQQPAGVFRIINIGSKNFNRFHATISLLTDNEV